jgi:RimJ/RimL family protein N-acetyltransferase
VVPIVTLRPEEPDDLIRLGPADGDSTFDDFGPREARRDVAPANLDADGRLVILDEGGSAVVGSVSWHWNQWGPNAASRCPMIGIWLRSEARGRGIGRAAQRELAELFFRHTTVNRVEAHTDVENIAEQRALEAAGSGAKARSGAPSGGMAPTATATSTRSFVPTSSARASCSDIGSARSTSDALWGRLRGDVPQNACTR